MRLWHFLGFYPQVVLNFGAYVILAVNTPLNWGVIFQRFRQHVDLLYLLETCYIQHLQGYHIYSNDRVLQLSLEQYHPLN